MCKTLWNESSATSKFTGISLLSQSRLHPQGGRACLPVVLHSGQLCPGHWVWNHDQAFPARGFHILECSLLLVWFVLPHSPRLLETSPPQRGACGQPRHHLPHTHGLHSPYLKVKDIFKLHFLICFPFPQLRFKKERDTRISLIKTSPVSVS